MFLKLLCLNPNICSEGTILKYLPNEYSSSLVKQGRKFKKKFLFFPQIHPSSCLFIAIYCSWLNMSVLAMLYVFVLCKFHQLRAWLHYCSELNVFLAVEDLPEDVNEATEPGIYFVIVILKCFDEIYVFWNLM